MRLLTRSACWCLIVCSGGVLPAETVFIEAETFQTSSPGWRATTNDQTRRASRTKTLWGADGPADSIANKKISLHEAGRYRIWVRYMHVDRWRGPFDLAVEADGKLAATGVFDAEAAAGVENWEYVWKSLDADLPTGEITLSIAKHEQKNCIGYVRHVDCLLLTNDMDLAPDHRPYGPQTYVRVTFGKGYERPVYMHLFADHYRSPWYAHYALARDGAQAALAPAAGQMLKSGESTPWCNLTPTVYQDSGAALNLSVRHSYHEKASRLLARFEFGRAASGGDQAGDHDIQVVKTFDVDATPNGVVIIAPPDLESETNLARLKRDRDFAEEVGRAADSASWPAYGKRPVLTPFLVAANIGGYELPVDAAVVAREKKTLGHVGFNGGYDRGIHGLWQMLEGSYCRPDLDKMKEQAAREAAEFHRGGRKIADIAYCMLMDEPTGQPASFAARDDAYRDGFRAWLGKKGLGPRDLLVESWDEVRPVVESDRDRLPALHYFTQLYRTRALGDFMAVQRQLIENAYQHSFPTLVNFSDGAVYHANFCGQGVDYFELLDSDDQNAIWGEDWANNSSTYQCAAFNVDLMRAAARRRGQTIGHYLIAHAGRTPWDVKLKATSETARGVRMWMNYHYGPSWGSHEGGPAWRSSVWYGKPDMYAANAEIAREIGAVEDWLRTSRPAPAKVAVLYSSSADIWTHWTNQAYGFDRMHTWLALAHAQIPVDIVPEREVAAGRLDDYQVCYLSGPNLTREAAAKLRSWVQRGGTLWLTAGAASRDEFNRPLDVLSDLSPAERGETATLDAFLSAGKFLHHLPARDTVSWSGSNLEVLSVKQSLTPREGGKVLATFADGKPAVVSRGAGKGRIIASGFLPALAYIKTALAARQPLDDKLAARLAAAANADQPEATNSAASQAPDAAAAGSDAADTADTADRERLARSHNPWRFEAAARELLLLPVRGIDQPAALTCDVPLVDAVALPCEPGTLVALANYTLQPLRRVTMELKADRPVAGVESVRHGPLKFERLSRGGVRWTMPLDASDWVKVTAE